MSPQCDPGPVDARRALERLARKMGRPYNAVKRAAVALRALAGTVASAVALRHAPPTPGVWGSMLTRLVILKERHEEALREHRGAGDVEWMQLEARVTAVQRTPVDRIAPGEIDALMTAMHDWTRRRPR